MAITVTNPTVKVGFIANGVSADASGCEELVAAVTDKAIKVRSLTINNGASALSHTIGAGETGGAVTAALIGPIAMAANTSLQFNFSPPMELPVSTALVVDSSGAGAVCVFAQGVIE
jgi:hypothetical protein